MNLPSTTDSLISTAAKSVKWSALMEVVSRTAAPLLFVVLARLLTPADFGVLTTAMILISFAQVFWDAGLGKALVQTHEPPEDAAHIVFWTNLLLGSILYLALFIFAPFIALFFRSPSSETVLRVLGFQIVIASLCSAQQAFCIRNFEFRRLFTIKVSTAFVPVFCSIPMAMCGYGVWALVAGSLTAQVLNAVLLWHGCSWRPRLSYDKNLAQRMFGFSFWVLAESFGAWLILWGDNLILGRFLGIHELGVYRTAWMLVTVLFGVILNPFIPVLFPTFSRFQHDFPALKSTFQRVNRVVIALALPMGIGLLFVGPEIAALLFGQKWQGLGFVMAILGLMHGLGWLVGINPELYRAMGRPDINTKLIFAALLYYLPAYYLAAQQGLECFTFIRLALALVAIPINIWLCTRTLGVSPWYLWEEGRPMIISSLLMAAGIAAVKWGIFPVLDVRLVSIAVPTLIGVGALTYFVSLWLLDKSFVLQTKAVIQKATSP